MELSITLLNCIIILFSLIIYTVLIIQRQKKKKKLLILLKQPVFLGIFLVYTMLYLNMIYGFYAQENMTINRYIIVGCIYMIAGLFLLIFGYYNLHYSIILVDGKIYVTKFFKATIYDCKDITDVKLGFFHIKFYKDGKKIFQIGGKDDYESPGFRNELRQCIPKFDEHFYVKK